jgi:hypothetical protein
MHTAKGKKGREAVPLVKEGRKKGSLPQGHSSIRS